MTNFNEVEILLVEDNMYDAELMVRALNKRGLANQLFTVEDGEEALDFLFARGQYHERNISNNPKVVFLDLKLPKLDGLEVLRAIRAHQATRTLPVVVVTSSAQDPDISAAYALGANSYVVKPVAFDEFFKVTAELGFYWLLVNRSPR
jgi:two-component system response regulator